MDETTPKAVVADGVELPIAEDSVAAQDNIGKKIVGGGAWRIVAYAFATLIAVFAISIISREVGPVDFAQFTTSLSLIAIAIQISDFGLLSLGVREYAALSADTRERTFRALITLRVMTSTLAAVGIVVFGIVMNYPQELVIGLAFAGGAVVIGAMQTSFTVPLQATYRLNLMAMLDATRQLLMSSSMITAALLTGSVGVIIATNLPVSIVMAVLAGCLVFRQVSILPSWDLKTMRSLIGDVGAFAVASSVGLMYAYFSQIVSDAVLSGHESGQFALAFRVYAVLLAGWVIAVSGAFPLLVTSSRDDIQRMIFATRRLIQTSVVVGAACTVGLVTGADFVVDVLGGAEFEEAAQLIAIVALGLPATFTVVTGSTVLLASGRHRELVAVSIAGAAVSIIFTWIASSLWDGVGAALGLTVGEVVIALSYLWLVWRIDRSALPGLLWLLGVVVAALAGCAIALTGLPALAAAIAGGAIFLVVGLVLRIFPPELTDRIPGHPKSA